jgi:predicted TIM-barrel fold metal-dependent hydrolase
MVTLIDVHRHLWDFGWFPPSHLPTLNGAAMRRTGRTWEEMAPRVKQSPVMDGTGTYAMEEMEHYGIDFANVLCLDWGMAYGPAEDNQVDVEEFHRKTAEAVARYPGRMSWFAGVDPRRPRSVAIFEDRRALLPDVREGDRARRAGADSHGRQHLGVAGVGGARRSALP